MNGDDKILKRKEARDSARTAAELVLGEAGRHDTDSQVAFWEEIGRLLPLPPSPVRHPGTVGVEPFNDAQARAWGKTRIPFGIHQSKRIDEVPLEYLEYLATPNEFVKHLRRYLASPRIQEEGRQDDDESS